MFWRGQSVKARTSLAGSGSVCCLAGSLGSAPQHPMRILIVDDDFDSGEELQLLLGAVGYEVKLVYERQHAAEVAIAFQPDVGVLDIGLGGSSGCELCAQLGSLTQLQHCAFSPYPHSLQTRLLLEVPRLASCNTSLSRSPWVSSWQL